MLVPAAAFTALADHLKNVHSDLMQRWRTALRSDSRLTTGKALPSSELYDHVPATLTAFERKLRGLAEQKDMSASNDVVEAAGAHGTHRWQQGYGLQEVVRELAHLNLILIAEMDAFGQAQSIDQGTMALARQAWAAAYGAGIEQSTSRFFALQQTEAAGHVTDLEAALVDITEIERHRAILWQQLAHDLRGNVGVVAAATRALAFAGAPKDSQARFVQMLERNVDSLRHLLDDVTSLTRLQAGTDQRQVATFDVSALLEHLCDGLQTLAQERGLYLRHAGPPEPLVVQGDAVKVRRLVQNLVINALKYTESGGVEVQWSECPAPDTRRWMLTVRDSGPGIHAGPGAPLVSALQDATGLAHDGAAASTGDAAHAEVDPRPVRQAHGEGIGLSIVKRLAELLDATVEVESAPDAGTVFTILLPKSYDA